jgi:hypothetical protein
LSLGQTQNQLKSRDHVLDFRRLNVQPDTRSIESESFDARVLAIAPLPQAFAGAANATPLFVSDAAEPAGPRACAACAHFDYSDHRTQARDDIDLERAQSQVRGDDVVAVGDEPLDDQRFSALAT